jgi:hypothetical protein
MKLFQAQVVSRYFVNLFSSFLFFLPWRKEKYLSFIMKSKEKKLEKVNKSFVESRKSLKTWVLFC